MKISLQTGARIRGVVRPPLSFSSVVSLLLLILMSGGCAPLFVSSGHQSGVEARLMMSFYGSEADIPIVVPNRTWENQKLQSLSYDFYLGDRKVAQGEVDYDKVIESRSELKLSVMIDIDETWLVETMGFGRTGVAPYRLAATALVGGAEVPVSVEGKLRMPGMRPR